jgi:hypothetical protein
MKEGMPRYRYERLDTILRQSGVQGTELPLERDDAIASIALAMRRGGCAPVGLPWRGLRGVRALAERVARWCGEVHSETTEVCGRTPGIFQWRDARRTYILWGSHMWDRGWVLEAIAHPPPPYLCGRVRLAANGGPQRDTARPGHGTAG